MAQTCPKCSRVNPAEALYCFSDGSPLPGHGGNGHGPRNLGFPTPFVFPSGQSCHNYDQLALACVDNWQTARDFLQQGYLERFFGGLGRADLAMAARDAARFPDADRGLDQLLTKLPAQSFKGPQMQIEPRQVNLGVQKVGTDSRLELRLTNVGMGLMHGSVVIDDNCPWLSVGEGQNNKLKLFQFLHEGVIPVQVRGQHLRAGPKPLEGKLTVESNGGTIVVQVTATVPITPFPEGVLGGAKSPRQVASAAHSNPKEAAALFEKGAVAAWYKTNGWVYPVPGPAASGLAAVQQFFEALGLTPPPKVEISEMAISLKGNAGDPLGHTLKVFSQERRPVYAHAVCDQTWLQVTGTKFDGNTATIRLSVRSVPNAPGETLRAMLTVTSNGNQRFEVPVMLTVGGRARAAAVPMLEVVEAFGPSSGVPTVSAVPFVPTVQSAPSTGAMPAVPTMQGIPSVQAVSAGGGRGGRQAEPLDVLPVVAAVSPAPMRGYAPAPVLEAEPGGYRPSRGGGAGGLTALLALVPIGILGLGLLVTIGHDLIKMATGTKTTEPTFSSSGEPLNLKPALALQFHDREEKVQVSIGGGGVKPGGADGGLNLRNVYWEPSMRFGLTLLDSGSGGMKKLTFEPKGYTNNAVVKLDGREILFGDRPWREENGTYQEDWPGKWKDREISLGSTPSGRKREGRQSVWVYEREQVYITQTVELVAGAQSTSLDTCLVTYKIENKDSQPHSVGIRFMLDTYIGENDGVPFTIPGRPLCNTNAEFNNKDEIPDFIQARESDNLTKPGTICQIGLKLGNRDSWPDRVTLGSWPNPQFNRRFHLNPLTPPPYRQEKTLWTVPVHSMQTAPTVNKDLPPDSAVVIYWNEQQIQPGKSREMGFTYGLGNVSGGEGGGQLAITTGGSFVPGGEFTVTAYVKDPRGGQTVTLELPSEFTLVDGGKTQNVPAAGGSSGTSPVSWKVRASKVGKFPIKVTSSTGVSQAQDVRIQVDDLFGKR